jgi:hypothetical protein
MPHSTKGKTTKRHRTQKDPRGKQGGALAKYVADLMGKKWVRYQVSTSNQNATFTCTTDMASAWLVMAATTSGMGGTAYSLFDSVRCRKVRIFCQDAAATGISCSVNFPASSGGGAVFGYKITHPVGSVIGTADVGFMEATPPPGSIAGEWILLPGSSSTILFEMNLSEATTSAITNTVYVEVLWEYVLRNFLGTTGFPAPTAITASSGGPLTVGEIYALPLFGTAGSRSLSLIYGPCVLWNNF